MLNYRNHNTTYTFSILHTELVVFKLEAESSKLKNKFRKVVWIEKSREYKKRTVKLLEIRDTAVNGCFGNYFCNKFHHFRYASAPRRRRSSTGETMFSDSIPNNGSACDSFGALILGSPDISKTS